MGEVTDAAIDVQSDEPGERAAARHAQALVSLEASADDALAHVRIDRLRDADDPADAWVREALASGAHIDDVNADAVRAAFEDDEPDELARAAFAQVYARAADGDTDDGVLPLDRLRAMPPSRACQDALRRSNDAGDVALEARDEHRRAVAAARASRQSEIDAAGHEMVAAADAVSKIERGYKRLTPPGTPDSWSDEARAKYDAHAAKHTAAREREANARAAVADLDAQIAATVGRSPQLDEADAASVAALDKMHTAFKDERARTRDLALHAAIPVQPDTLPILSRAVSPQFSGADLTKLSAWADESIRQRGWNADDAIVLTETRNDLTLSMVRLPRGGWGVVGLTPELRRETTVAANLQRGAGGL